MVALRAVSYRVGVVLLPAAVQAAVPRRDPTIELPLHPSLANLHQPVEATHRMSVGVLQKRARESAQQFGVTGAVPAARRCADSECFRVSRRDRTQEVTKPLLYH